MKWSILIASHVSRRDSLYRLIGLVEPQLTPQVEVDVLWNRGQLGIGEYRQKLLDKARGEYVNFVDDDDRIPDHYVSDILEALETDPDYVGFQVHMHDASDPPVLGKREIRVEHSIRYEGWFGRAPNLYRDISHLNPIRRDIAIKGRFVGGRSEDRKWAKEVRPWVKTEVYIPKVMYFYDFERGKSVPHERFDRRRVNPPDLPEGFNFHPDSDA